MALSESFLALEGELNARYFERRRLIRGLLVGLLARGNVLVLGPPGTAKTELAHILCGQLGGKFFARLLTKVSAPEELFGPLSLKGLENDEYRRVTAGRLPEADVAVIDEVFKCNSAVLNTLLPIMNERVFFDESGQGRPIPLLLLVGLSNELPEGGPAGELAALWDRFELRYVVDYLRDERSFAGMLSLNGAGPLSTRVSIEDVRRAQAEAAAVELPDAVLAALVRLWKRLRERGITVSDRRFRNGIRYLKAHAWLEGRARVAEDDLEILADLLWQEPEQALEVRKLVLELANPLVAKAEELYDKAVERYQRLQNMDENAKDEADHKKVMETASETLGQLRRIGRSLQALISQAEKEGCNPARIGQWLADVERMFQEISRVYMMGGL